MDGQRPTLAQIRKWPASVNVETAALALGISRASLYTAIAEDRSPVEVIIVGRRKKILTHSLVSVLTGTGLHAESA